MATKKFWICNKINPTTAEILMYGYISQYDISSADFIIELSQLAAIYSDIKIRINSAGGSVFEGIAIYNAIRGMIKKGKNITTRVDGIAASMAGVVFEAGEKREISKYGRVMTHRAKGYAEGDADDIRQQAQLVEDAEGDLCKIFSERTGLTEEEVKKKFMQKGVDNWLNAAKCIEYGLADEVYDAEEVAVPENVTDERELYNIFETCLNKTFTTQKNNMKEISKALGLPDTATEAEILTAIKKQNSDMQEVKDAAVFANKAKAKVLVDTAINNKQLTEADRTEYEEMAVNNYDFTVKAIAKIPVAKRPSELLNRKGVDNKETDAEEVSDWQVLVNKGSEAVAAFKKESFSQYKQMWEAHYKAPFPEPNA